MKMASSVPDRKWHQSPNVVNPLLSSNLMHIALIMLHVKNGIQQARKQPESKEGSLGRKRKERNNANSTDHSLFLRDTPTQYAFELGKSCRSRPPPHPVTYQQQTQCLPCRMWKPSLYLFWHCKRDVSPPSSRRDQRKERPGGIITTFTQEQG